jgi:hypothetical protein
MKGIWGRAIGIRRVQEASGEAQRGQGTVARSYERFGEVSGLKAVRSGEVRRGQETVRRGSERLKKDRQ